MRRYSIIFLAFLLLQDDLLLAQDSSFNPYNINTRRELAYFSGGILFNLGGLLLKTGKSPFTEEEYLHDTSTADIPSFDAKALDQYDEAYLTLSNAFLLTTLALPFLNLSDGKINDEAGTAIVLYFETVVITAGVWSVTTGLVNRRRPYTYNPEVGFEDINVSNARDSYFSGHTALSASAAFCGARIFSDFKPNSKLKPLVWGVAATFPAFIGYARYKAGRHFPSDVITGYLLGASIGYLIPTLHKIDKSDRLSLYPFYDGNGFALSYQF